MNSQVSAYETLEGGAALSSMERLALENLDMGDGLSDSESTKTLGDTGPKNRVWKKCGKVPGAPKNRDAMGNYVPPPGEGYLSSFGSESTPGPNQYNPNNTTSKKVYPKYSLGRLPPKPMYEPLNPGPKYQTAGKMNWGKCRKFTLKDPIAMINKKVSPGPTTAKQKKFKPTGPKHSMARVYKRPYMLNSSLAMPLNPDTPGPKYLPDTPWLNKPTSFGTIDRTEKAPPGPGPGKYAADKVEKGPWYTIGNRVCEKDKTTPGPGPGRYKIKANLGKYGPKAPLGIKHVEPNYKAWIPGPDIYHRAGFRLDEPGVTMKYRWMDGPGPVIPGPADYNLMDLKPEKAPAFSIKNKNKEIIKKSPGPCEYTPHDVTKCKGQPGKTFGVKWKQHKIKTETAASDFPDSDTTVKQLPLAPAYSFGSKTVRKKPPPQTPGPQQYYAKLPGSKQTISMGRVYPPKKPPVGPGPAYPFIADDREPDECPPHRGPAASLKSRHTPLKFTGMKDSSQIPPATGGVNCVPLLG